MAAVRAHAVRVAVRLARRASLRRGRHEFLAAGAVKDVVDDVVIGMGAVIVRHARQRLVPALLRVVRQHAERMLADMIAFLAFAVHIFVRLARNGDTICVVIHLTDAAGAVIYIVAGVGIRMRGIIVRGGRHDIIPALFIVERPHGLRMPAHLAADPAHAVLAAPVMAAAIAAHRAAAVAPAVFARHAADRAHAIPVAPVVAAGIAALRALAVAPAVLACLAALVRAHAVLVAPVVALRFALGHAAPAARLRRCAGRLLPAVALRLAFRLAAHTARLRLRAGRSLPLMTAGIAAHRAHAVAPAMRLAAPRLLRQRARHARDKHRRRQQGEQSSSFHLLCLPFPIVISKQKLS